MNQRRDSMWSAYLLKILILASGKVSETQPFFIYLLFKGFVCCLMLMKKMVILIVYEIHLHFIFIVNHICIDECG